MTKTTIPNAGQGVDITEYRGSFPETGSINRQGASNSGQIRETPHCGRPIACNQIGLMTGQAPRLGPAIGGLTGDPHRWGRFVREKAKA
jgi:hypothetical protein